MVEKITNRNSSMSDLQITVYTPDSSLTSPLIMLRGMFSDLLAGRELAWQLAVRDIRGQYRQAFFGMLWALILPLASAFAWVFLDTSGIIDIGETAVSYPFYAFTGTMLWAIFMDALNAPLQQVNAARGLLAKLNFPREALILSGIYQVVFNASIKLALMLGALLLVGINPGWGLLLFPVGVLSLILVGTAAGLLITPVGMLYSDVGRVIPLLMQFAMFLTPVVFPIPQGGWAATLFALNPLTPVVHNARAWLAGLPVMALDYYLAVMAVAVIVLLLGWAVYRLAMPILIERMSA